MSRSTLGEPSARHDTVTSVQRAPVTARALVVGALLIPPNVLWLTSMELIWNSGQPTMMSLFFSAVFTLLVLAVLNLALRRWIPRWALSPGELATVYAMVTMGSAVAGHDFLQVLVNELPMATYYNSDTNGWVELFREYLDANVLVSDPRAVWDFWEGDGLLYERGAIRPWLAPLATWTVFVLAIVGAMMVLDVLVWRRWSEQEKLTYPLTDIPFKLTEPGMGIIGPSLMGSRLFWIGFGIAASLDLYNGIATLQPAWPILPLTGQDLWPYQEIGYPWRAMGRTWISAYPFAIGLGYLMPQDFLFSCWFFYWFWKLELVGAWATGYSRLGVPFVQEQTFGAYVAIAIFALWAGRRYYAAVVGQVLRGRHPADEKRQALPYQLALAALVALLAVATAFVTNVLGVTLAHALIYLASYLALSLAITRMRAEFGLPVHDLFTGPFDMMTRIGGTRWLGRRNILGLGLLYWLERVQRSHPMPHAIESLALGERRGVSPAGVFGALGLAVIVGMLAAYWANLHLAYTHGFASTPADASYLAKGAFSRPQSLVAVDRSWHPTRLGALLVGGAFSIGLLLMRQRYVWWPFHPAGFAASSIVFMGLMWLPMLIAWTIKGLTLRYGGQRLYRRLLPLFIGLVLGEFTVGSVWGLIGAIGRFPTYRFWAY